LSNSNAPANLIGAKLGNYRIERLLGRGRMGMVYLARDEALLRHVAVKVLAWSLAEAKNQDPEAWLLSEARNIARVSHPAVIQVHGVARHGPYAYIAMEFVDGVSAEQMLKDKGPFPPGPATEILLRIASALQAAHECGVIHRDVKPANILIRSDGSAKLGDFGMAIHRQAPSAAATGHPQVGTPLYTAPEIWNGAEASPATDLYALGATYHHLLTGRPPFEAEDLPTLVQAHLTQRPPRLGVMAQRLPEACVQVVEACLAKSAAERPASAQALAWMARGVLRALERGGSQPARRSSSTHASVQLPSARPAPELLGLSHSPFADFPEIPDLESYEPFRSVGAELRAALRPAGACVYLAGQPGSGRSRLLRGILARGFWVGPVAWLDVDLASAARPLDQRACLAFGALPSTTVSKDSGIEGLLDHLASTAKASKGPALLVVDAAVPMKPHAHTLQALSVAARATGYFALVVLGGGDAASSLADAEIVVLPPLSARQLVDYLSGRIKLAREPGTAPLLLSPDAALIIHARSGGNISKANRIANRMLAAAIEQKTRVLTSSHAWNAADLTEGLPPASARRGEWPTPEVTAILNAERAALGVEPRSTSSPTDESPEQYEG
jgi:serine/threonine protein kinase